jgi:hypothetical protein
MIASPTDVLSGADDDLALGLLERLRLLEPADLHAIASSVDDKLRLRQLERQLETLQRSHEA